MKEITMITTCEITTIVKVTDDAALLVETNKDAVGSQIAERIKSDMDADDVNILKNQIFIRDVQN